MSRAWLAELRAVWHAMDGFHPGYEMPTASPILMRVSVTGTLWRGLYPDFQTDFQHRPDAKTAGGATTGFPLVWTGEIMAVVDTADGAPLHMMFMGTAASAYEIIEEAAAPLYPALAELAGDPSLAAKLARKRHGLVWHLGNELVFLVGAKPFPDDPDAPVVVRREDDRGTIEMRTIDGVAVFDGWLRIG